jgi:hypothetical protein
MVEAAVEKEAKAVVAAEKEVEAPQEAEVVGMVVVVAKKEVEAPQEVEVVGMVVVAAAEKEAEAVGMVVEEMDVEVVVMVVVEGGKMLKHLYNFHSNILKIMDIHCHKTHN